MIEPIFSLHAAQRWHERFANLDYFKEIKSAKRNKRLEKRAMKNGFQAAKIYCSDGGVAFVISRKDKTVITVFKGSR